MPSYNECNALALRQVLIGKRVFYIDLEKTSCHKFATAMLLIAQIIVMLNFLPLQ
jgi:hypothetical protein